jgi:hypothetical protein
MKLCTCNHCGNIWEDTNPQTDAKEYPEYPVFKPLEKLFTNIYTKEYYWGCPVCCTDSYLSDEVDGMTATKTIARFIQWVTINHGDHGTTPNTECEAARKVALYNDGLARFKEVYDAVVEVDDGWEESWQQYLEDVENCREEKHDPPNLRYRDDGGTDGG